MLEVISGDLEADQWCRSVEPHDRHRLIKTETRLACRPSRVPTSRCHGATCAVTAGAQRPGVTVAADATMQTSVVVWGARHRQAPIEGRVRVPAVAMLPTLGGLPPPVEEDG